MKTLLTTAAMAAFLVTGAAIAEGPGMNGQGMKDHRMSSSHADMQKEMQARMHDDDERHPGKRYGEKQAGKHSHDGYSGSESDHSGRDHDSRDHDNRGYGDDDDYGRHHKNQMDRDRS